MLKVYSWEPSKCYDSIPVNWGEVADIAIGHNQLVSKVKYCILTENYDFIFRTFEYPKEKKILHNNPFKNVFDIVS